MRHDDLYGLIFIKQVLDRRIAELDGFFSLTKRILPD
jgi:hypothetical protein